MLLSEILKDSKLDYTSTNEIDYTKIDVIDITRDTGDLGSIPGLGRSHGEGNGNPLPYSFLENSMDRGAWWATLNGVAKNKTQLSMHTGIISIGFLGGSVVKNPPANQETWV